MKKLIEIDFPDDFMPPDEIKNEICAPDWTIGASHRNCPFFYADDWGDNCGLKDQQLLDGYKCPIKKYFK